MSGILNRNWVKKAGLATLVLLVVAQFWPVDRTNPEVDPAQTIYATVAMPTEVKALFERSCENCHSDETYWPWYSYVAPTSWIVAKDVHQGRAAMNLSEWGSYPEDKRTDKLEEICEQLTNGDMPYRNYLLIHRRARITAKDRDIVCQWTEDSRQY